MNKKLISALFVGALLLGSTSALTSCKDYDDDINSLQGQIDKAALASDVAALKTSLDAATANATAAKTTATAAKTTAESALAKAQAANDALAAKAAQADLTAAVARITALEAQMTKLTNFETELKAAVDSKLADLQKQFDTLKAEIMDTIGSMITEVSLVASYANHTSVPTTGAIAISPKTGKQIAFVFGKADTDNHILGAATTETFTKDAPINFAEGLIIRVNPTNAVITKDNVKLMNSNGKDLSDVLEISEVNKYTELLTRSGVAATGTGLWQLSIKLKDGVTDAALKAVTLKNGAAILYAVVANNTTDEKRSVASTYDVTFPGAGTYVGNYTLLDVKVNKTAISDIHNRFSNTELGGSNGIFTDGDVALTNPAKTTGSWDKKYVAVAGAKPTGTENDDRQGKKIIAVNVGQEVPIEFPAGSNVKSYYVVLDTQNSIESDNSEINAWNSYTYTGLNTIYSVEEGSSISVTSMGLTGDIIGFRIYAVNFDGTVADPDGAAFYLYVGQKNNYGTAIGDFTADKKAGYTMLLPLTGTYADGAATTGTLTFKNGVTGTWSLVKSDGKSTAGKWSEAAYVKFVAASASGSYAYEWEDGTSSTATLTAAKDGLTVNTVEVTATKKLPPSYPSTFSWKAQQLVDGVFTCYVDPVITAGDVTAAGNASTPITLTATPNYNQAAFPFEWANLTAIGYVHGFKNLNNAVNGLDDTNYTFSFADADYKADGKTLKALEVSTTTPNDYQMIVNKKFVDGAAHATSIKYVYADVSSAADGNDWVVDVNSVSTKFECVLNTTLQTYDWIKSNDATDANGKVTTAGTLMNSINYTTPMTTQYIAGQFLKGTNAYDGNFTNIFDKLAKYYKISATLTSNENGQEDYFTVTYGKVADASMFTVNAANGNGTTKNAANDYAFIFTPKSGTTNPKADVPSTLNVTLQDVFGHKNVYHLAVTVVKQ